MYITGASLYWRHSSIFTVLRVDIHIYLCTNVLCVDIHIYLCTNVLCVDIHIFPVYKCQLYMYLFLNRLGQKLSSPIFFLFRHVLNETEPPFKSNYALINTYLSKCCWKWSKRGSKKGLLYSGSCPSSPFLTYKELSFRWRKHEESEAIPLHDLLDKIICMLY